MRFLCNFILCFTLLCTILNVSGQQSNVIIPIETPSLTTPTAKWTLGKTLYFDPLFSFTYADSCNSCHKIEGGGVDNLTRYVGIYNKLGALNTPSTLNAKLNFRQFWNGRAKTLGDVIDDHLNDPQIFKSNWNESLKRIKGSPLLKTQFEKTYKQKQITSEQVKDALITYLQTLMTPNSRFDRYLKGEKDALNNNTMKGYNLFKSYGCITCHQGPNMGGNIYQKMGIYKNYFAEKGTIHQSDYGLFLITGKEEDKFVFKVPSLRNISITGPYLHDGSAKTLKEVIQIMGIYQIGQTIPPHDVELIAEFLETLTGTPVQNERKH